MFIYEEYLKKEDALSVDQAVKIYQAIGELAQRYADAWVGGAGLFWAPGIVVGLGQNVVIVIV